MNISINIKKFLKTSEGKKIVELAKVFKSQFNKDLFLVGGSVRDILLGKDVNDFDIAAGVDPYIFNSIFGGKLTENVGTVFFRYSDQEYEYTPFRIEGDYINGRKPGTVEFSENLEDDALRRDFTINSIYLNILTAEIIDIYGGINDLNNGIIRCVGNSYDRFNEDYLRILRALRFSAKFGFEIEEETHNAILELKDNLSKITKGRIFSELIKGFRFKGFVQLLIDNGVIGYVHNEFNNCYGLDQKTIHHAYDTMEHILQVFNAGIKYFPNQSDEFFLGLLFHDIGKPKQFFEQRRFEYGTKEFFRASEVYAHEKVGIDILKDGITEKDGRARPLDSEQIKYVSNIIKYHQDPALYKKFSEETLEKQQYLMRKLYSKVGNENFMYDLFEMSFCDKIGTGTISEEEAQLIYIKQVEVFNDVKDNTIFFYDVCYRIDDLRKELGINALLAGGIINKVHDRILQGRLYNEKNAILKFTSQCIDKKDPNTYLDMYSVNNINTINELYDLIIDRYDEFLNDYRIIEKIYTYGYKEKKILFYINGTVKGFNTGNQQLVDTINSYCEKENIINNINYNHKYVLVVFKKAYSSNSLDDILNILNNEVTYIQSVKKQYNI